MLQNVIILIPFESIVTVLVPLLENTDTFYVNICRTTIYISNLNIFNIYIYIYIYIKILIP